MELCRICSPFTRSFLPDVPPLEDLTDVLSKKKMKPRPLYEPRVRMRNEAEKRAGTSKPVRAAGKKPEQDEKPRSFGGFSKGFLLSSSTSTTTKKPTKKKGVEKNGEKVVSGCGSKKTGGGTAEKEDIPFLKPQTQSTKAPVLPEVQEAMKEAYSLMDTQGEQE